MSAPSVNPIGFRLPFEIEGKAEPEIVQALHYHDDGLVDLNQAIVSLKSQMGKSSATTTTTTAAAGGVSATEQIIQQTVNQTNITQPTTGFVNDQTGATAYTTQQSDYGNEIVLNSASPIAVTLNTQGTAPGIQLPWYTYISNQGSGTATLTPASGTINGGASLGVPGGSFGILFFDGTNFELLIPVSGGSGVTQLLAGAGIALSPAGGTGAVTVTVIGATGSYTSGSNTNGYWQKDPAGLTRQWGTVTAGVTGTVVTFPTAFTNASSVAVTITSLWPGSGSIAFVSVESGSISTSQFQVAMGVTSTQGFNWFAIGY